MNEYVIHPPSERSDARGLGNTVPNALPGLSQSDWERIENNGIRRMNILPNGN